MKSCDPVMNKLLQKILQSSLLACACSVGSAQIWQNTHIGYVYPAGGQVGTTFEVAVGGKGLQKIGAIQVSGSGVTAEFVEYIGNYKRKYQEQIRVIRQQRSGNAQQVEKSKERRFGPRPDHDMFTRLEELPPNELREVATKFQKKERIQRNRELNDLAILRITVDPDAKPGMRELRILTTNGGASNPLRFMVNTLPEASEYEPNDRATPEQSHMQIPFIMNGQVMPGDEDNFSFEASKGQNIVIHVKARELVPYLADAVPGWFQAIVEVFDDNGNEMAYADDFQFNPDPALLFKVPESGTYHIKIRDSIFRGREDFVYRVAVGEIPLVTGIFPLGAQVDSDSVTTAQGWNLNAPQFALNTSDRGHPVKRGFLHSKGTISNYVRYEVGQLPEVLEIEMNDDFDTAHPIEMESTINGRIDRPGDLDVYSFKASAGQSVQATITARRLYSPVDSLIRVFDPDGKIIGVNDDMPKSGNMTDRTGLLTHNADSEVQFTAEKPGTYFIQVSDAQQQGGPTHSYRLTLTDPSPDFELYATPSTITIPNGGGGKAILHVKRKNGFNGAIQVKIANKGSGLKLSGGRIPPGCDRLPVVISSRPNMKGRFMRVNLTGTAQIKGESITKRAIPADDITQAFITHHLVETNTLSAYILPSWKRAPSVELKTDGRAILSEDHPITISLQSKGTGNGQLTYELEEAPPGITLETVNKFSGTELQFTATEELEDDLKGNLVVGVYFQFVPKTKKGKPRKLSIGVLPAIPYQTQ